MSKAPPVPEDQPLTEEEQRRLDAIREAHRDRIAKHNVHYLTLLRFLRGYKDDPKPVEKSIEMLGKMLTWREEQKVDEIVATPLERADEFNAIWPTGCHGFGKNGNLIYVDRVGSVDPSKLMGKGGFTIEDVKKFHIQMMERVNRMKEEQYARTGIVRYKNIVILDLGGMGMGHLGSKFTSPMKSFIQIDQEYYPESLYQMVICNAGWILKTLWAVISPFIDPLTKERIKFGTKHLEEIIDVEQIPRYLGGKCKCAGGKCLVAPFEAGYNPPRPALTLPAQPNANANAASSASSSSSSSAAAPASSSSSPATAPASSAEATRATEAASASASAPDSAVAASNQAQPAAP